MIPTWRGYQGIRVSTTVETPNLGKIYSLPPWYGVDPAIGQAVIKGVQDAKIVVEGRSEQEIALFGNGTEEQAAEHQGNIQ